MVLPIALKLQAWAACYYTKQHNIKSSTEENDAINSGKHQVYEAAASVTWLVFYSNFF